ncbi:putative nitroreductase [Taxawa tesnikishii (nom. ined.)]|nr:putative nitroreductase [Dothideales sp. JES 119]
MSNMSFLDAVANRRSNYVLTDKIPISDDRVVELATAAIKNVPSSFNSQSARMVVLLNDEHKKFWEITKEVLKPQVPEDKFGATEKKLDGFKAGHGTILFFEDPKPVKDLQSAFPLYATHFPQWSEHTSAMHQYMMWCALEAEGCGANLQHYNPVVDQRAKNEWNIDLEWELKAQLVFGGNPEGYEKMLPEKSFRPTEGRLIVHGKL